MFRPVLLLALAALLLAPGPAAAAARKRKTGDPIPGQWIVMYNSTEAKEEYTRIALVETKRRVNGMTVQEKFGIGEVGSGANGEVVKMPAKLAKRLRRIKNLTVEQDRWVVLDEAPAANVTDTGSAARDKAWFAQYTGTTYWGLDRIDQRSLPLDQRYYYLDNAQGQGVTVYVLDTGIRTTHVEFQGRASNVATVSSIQRAEGDSDLNGHGTHVAGTIGGLYSGVAKQVSVRGVKVLDRNGSGSLSGIISGINWVASNCKTLASRRCIISMSLGAPFSSSVNSAVAAAWSAGLVVIVAAGNDNALACNYSPASAYGTVTVGATDSSDWRTSFSNYGGCVDIFAPGVDIVSTYHTADTATASLAGTSMATPQVSGTAAIIWSQYPYYTNSQVTSALLRIATTSKVSDTKGSANRLLYTP